MGKFQKLTLENLLDRKSKQDKMGLATLDVASLGATVPILKIKTRKVFEITDKYGLTQDTFNSISNYDMMCELIYKCVPILQAKELKEQLGVPTPYEVVGELFDFAEMQKITEYIMELHGLTDKESTPVDDEIKN